MANNNDNKPKNTWRSGSESHWHSRNPDVSYYANYIQAANRPDEGKSAKLVDGKVVWSQTSQRTPASHTSSWSARSVAAQASRDAQAPTNARPQTSYTPRVSAAPSNPARSNDGYFAGRTTGFPTVLGADAPEPTPAPEAPAAAPRPASPAERVRGAQGTPSRRPSLGRELVDYDLDSRAQQQEQLHRTPSWYDEADAERSVSPRPLIDQEFRGSRRDSTSQGHLHFSERRGFQLPFGISPKLLLGLAIALLLIVAVYLATGCSSKDIDTTKETLAVSDTADTGDHTTELTISFAGDCTLGTDENFDTSTNFNAEFKKQDGDYSYFFKNVADIFAKDDLTVVNLEGTFTDSTSRADKKFAFKGPASYTNILTKGNIDVVDVANNHSHDYGSESYDDTLKALKKAGIPSFGYEDIAYTEVQGVKVALIGTYELAEGEGIESQMLSNIKKAKKNDAEIIIVYFHWGIEREATPDATQKKLGRSAIDAGATLVVGSHPHVIQGYETYKGRYIVYSMGNFCFGGNANPTDKDTWIFQQTFKVTGNEIDTSEINVIPCSLSSTSSRNDYQPTPAKGDEKKRIAKKIKERSDAI